MKILKKIYNLLNQYFKKNYNKCKFFIDFGMFQRQSKLSRRKIDVLWKDR